MGTWKERLLDLLFPRKCPFCGAITERDEPCARCQKELPWLMEREAECFPEFVEKAASALRYQGEVKACIHRLKFHRDLSLAKPLGHLAAQCAQDHFRARFDFVTYPPLSAKSLKQRGFDQAKLLAEAVGAELKLSVENAFNKSNLTQQQSLMKTPSQRRANVAGAYFVRREVDVKGKTILLVDDVITTGATVSECAVMLLAAGAEAVYAVSPVRGGGKVEE